MEEKKRKYNKPWGGHKKQKQLSIEVGMTGFLCTCNFKEKDCIRDAYRLLESFSNDSCDDDKKPVEAEGAEEAVGKDLEEEEDISDALGKEIEALRDKKPADKKFQYIDTGVKNIIFMRTTVPDPLALTTKIIKHLDETKKPRSRFILRLIPVLLVCKANVDDIKAKANDLFDKYFVEEPKTFAIVFNRHYNNSMQRGDVIEALAALISEKNPGNKADLTNPEIAVLVEVVKSHCLLSIAPEYFKYRKYNLTEICVVKGETGDEGKAKGEGLGDGKSEGVEGTGEPQADDNEGGEDSGGPDVSKDLDKSSEME
ncbi:THUMP domain-containing protein 1 homolog [Diachasma alloeum]|uniref:THUMP domain-containing protein 1 homolog n=1 Tax=Diachasma alloeum TaxID=454923 RepID=UPI0007384CBA|nr:THUMP domain-containing protein 1 homolog [Diachasma alloeum]